MERRDQLLKIILDAWENEPLPDDSVLDGFLTDCLANDLTDQEDMNWIKQRIQHMRIYGRHSH